MRKNRNQIFFQAVVKIAQCQKNVYLGIAGKVQMADGNTGAVQNDQRSIQKGKTHGRRDNGNGQCCRHVKKIIAMGYYFVTARLELR